MNFPFVSRARFDDQRAELDRVREELKRAVDAKEKLWNVMLWRMGGVIVDVDALPQPYQPKQATEAPKTEGPKPVGGKASPQAVRTQIARFEVQREDEFVAKLGRPRPVKPEPEQAAVLADLNQAANEATKAS